MKLAVPFDVAAARRMPFAIRRRTTAWWLNACHTAQARTERPRRAVLPITRVVTPTAWTVLTLAAAALVGGVLLDWSELTVAWWLSVGLLATSVMFILGRHQLTAHLNLSRDHVIVGQPATGSVHLVNESGRRTLPLSVELTVGSGRKPFDLPSLPGHAEHEELFRIPTSRRAVLTVGPVRTVRADPLGLLHREQTITEPEVLYVHPRTVRVDSSASGLVRDLEGETVRVLSNNDVAFHALRGYVPGDDRRSIHWKTSARTGKLMVRQYEETRRSHMLIVLSTRLDDYASDEEFEDAISIAASLGVRTLTEGHTLTATTSRRRLSPGSARYLLDQYAGVEYEASAPSLSEVARRLARDHAGASVAIIVCGSLTDASEIRKARRYLPLELRAVVMRSEPAAATTLRQLGDVDVATLGSLEDLGPTLRRLSR